MNLNYEFSDCVWWRQPFYSYSNQDLIKQINKYIRASKEFFADTSNTSLIDDFDKEYRIVYLKDCLIGEGNIPSSCSTNYIENVLEGTASIDTNDIKQMREVKKIKNMHQVINNVFQNMIFPDLDINLFDSSLSNSIHSTIGFELIDRPGLYRQTDAKPYGENFRYLPYENIPVEMEKLFQITKDEMNKIGQEIEEEQIERVIKVASQFLRQFLYIHPYTNGNGRTARILTSYLLSKISVVPVLLTASLTEGVRKDTYLDCLREIQGRIEEPPIALSTFLLESVFLSIEHLYKTLIL